MASTGIQGLTGLSRGNPLPPPIRTPMYNTVTDPMSWQWAKFFDDLTHLALDASSSKTIQGQTGVYGFTGIFGQTGIKGDTGVQGQTGIQGLTGTQGQTGISGTASSTIRRQWTFSLPQVANGTPGYFMKAGQNSAGGMLATTLNTGGLQNGNVDPYVALNDCTVNSSIFTWSGCSVAQSTVAPNPTMAMDIYRTDYSSRALLGNITVPVDQSKCGVNNSVSGNNFQYSKVLGLSVVVKQGNCWGLQFTSNSTDNTHINGLASCFATLETTE